jgi:hypothetical protein
MYISNDELDYKVCTSWHDEEIKKLILPKNCVLVNVRSYNKASCVGCVFVNKYYDCVNSPLYCRPKHIYKVKMIKHDFSLALWIKDIFSKIRGGRK